MRKRILCHLPPLVLLILMLIDSKKDFQIGTHWANTVLPFPVDPKILVRSSANIPEQGGECIVYDLNKEIFQQR